MAETFDIEIKAPLGGTVRNAAFQEQAPFSAFDSLNYWPIDVKTGRFTYATRPGMTPITTPGGSIVNLLCRINGVKSSDPYQSIIASFGGHLYYWGGSSWTAATGAQANSIPTGRPVFATPLLQKAYIATTTGKPIVFDYPTGAAATISESAGTAPSDCRIAATWLGCVWLAAQRATPHLLYGSRTGNGLDWDYSVPATDTGGAFYSGSVGFDGLLSGNITALMPQTSDTMIVSTLEGLKAMRGHPRRGGIFDTLSNTQYVLGQGAWCKGPGDVLYFMTPLGMMALEPTYGAIPAQVSRNKIPEELVGLDYDDDNPVVSMEYDSRWNVVYITVRGAQGQAWLFDIQNGAFHRLDYQGYPYVMTEFPPFMNATTSGVLFGGGAYGGLASHDTESDEVFPAGAIIGPIKISKNATKKNKVRKMRFVFGRDTPASDVVGSIRLSAGKDGQDAINRFYLNKPQYTAELVDVGNNDGLVYPQISGHALAIQFTQSRGSVVLEDIVAELEPAGDNHIVRSPQVPVTGEPVDPNDPRAEFDPLVWGGYSEGTPLAPTCTLPGYTHFIDLSLLPVGWWDRVESDGRDIRATNALNGEVPYDLISFDATTLTGFLAVKLDQDASAQKVRLWVGNPDVAQYAADADYGQYNAYDSNWIMFAPAGGGNDRTSNLNHQTMTGATAGDSVGPMGNLATDFGGNSNWYGRATAGEPAATYPQTQIVAFNRDAATTTARGAIGTHNNAAATHNAFISPGVGSTLARTDATVTAGGSADVLTGTTNGSPYGWRHYSAVFESATSRISYIDGGNANTDTTSVAPNAPDEIIVGKGSRSGLTSSSVQGELSIAQIHNTARPACWLAYQAEMLDQAAFWDWAAFVEINEPVPDAPLASACPAGFVPVAETGTWSGYAQATPVAPVAALERDWTHYINLALMPADWWTAVSANGQDIRATDTTNTFIPLDLIEFNKTANTGLAAVKLTQSLAAPRPIRLWVGNGSAVAVSPCATYGQYAAYDHDWIGFWPEGGGEDRTAYQHDLTAMSDLLNVAVPDFGGATGPIGNTATTYDGTAQFALGNNTYQESANTPLSFVVPLKLNDDFDPDYGVGIVHHTLSFREQVSLGMYTPSPISSIKLEHTHGDTRTRMLARSEDLQLGKTSTLELTGLGDWHLHSGVAENSVTRVAYMDGINTSPLSANNKVTPVRDMEKIIIGAMFNGIENVSYLSATTSLVSLHKAVRSAEWMQYHHDMLNQATFWNVAWSWTADSDTLPQS